jgi:hypothetical protein
MFIGGWPPSAARVAVAGVLAGAVVLAYTVGPVIAVAFVAITVILTVWARRG